MLFFKKNPKNVGVKKLGVGKVAIFVFLFILEYVHSLNLIPSNNKIASAMLNCQILILNKFFNSSSRMVMYQGDMGV